MAQEEKKELQEQGEKLQKKLTRAVVEFIGKNGTQDLNMDLAAILCGMQEAIYTIRAMIASEIAKRKGEKIEYAEFRAKMIADINMLLNSLIKQNEEEISKLKNIQKKG